MAWVTKGNVIRLTVASSTTTGATLVIYDEKRNTLVSATTTSGVTDGTAQWYYDYTTLNVGTHYYEFETTTNANKSVFHVTWG